METSTTQEGPRETQADLKTDPLLERAAEAMPGEKGEAVPGEKAAAAVTCFCCGEGVVRAELARFNRGFGIIVLIMGLLLSVFAVLLVGLPLVVIGAYLAVARRSVWMCPECGVVVDRYGT